MYSTSCNILDLRRCETSRKDEVCTNETNHDYYRLRETFLSVIGHCQHRTAHGRPLYEKDRRVIQRRLPSLLVGLVLPWSLGNKDRSKGFGKPVRIEVVLVEGQVSVIRLGNPRAKLELCGLDTVTTIERL
jgi:hypothetical protein